MMFIVYLDLPWTWQGKIILTDSISLLFTRLRKYGSERSIVTAHLVIS
jgi:hypothetical protein